MKPVGNQTTADNARAPAGFIGRGAALTLSGQGVKILVQFVSAAVLGRLLIPADFGMMGTVGPLLTFFVIFRDLGLTNVAVQRPDISHQDLTNLFWINGAAGFLIAVVVACLGPLVARFYDDERLTTIVLVLATTFAFNGLSAQYLAILQRQFQVGRLVVIDVVSVATGTAAGIVAALVGCGYWSLAIMPVVTQVVSLVLVLEYTRWHPGLLKRRSGVIGLMRSGSGYAGFNVFNFFARNLDTILVGKMLGEETLGYYNRAYSLMLLPLSQVTNPLAQVMIPMLSRLTDDPEAYRAAYLHTLRKVMFVCCPLIMANVVGADWTVGILLGPKWMPSAELYAVLGLSALVQPVGNSTGWLFISQGRSKDMFVWSIFGGTITVVAFLIGLHWGVVGLAWGYTVVMITVISPALWFWVGRRGPITFADLARTTLPFLVSSLLAGGFFMAIRNAWQPGPVLGLMAAAFWHIGIQIAVFAVTPRTRATIREVAGLVYDMYSALKEVGRLVLPKGRGHIA